MLIYNNEPVLFKLGDECVSSVYLGDEQVYPCGISGALSLELLPNYNTIGVKVVYSGSDETGYVYYRESGQCELAFGTDLHTILDHSGVNTNRYMSTIFDLVEGTNYDVFVAFKDGNCGQGAVTTRVAPTSPPTPVRIRYVSPSGSGASFTIGSPGSIDNAISGLTTGDEIRLMDGEYYVGGYDKLVTGIDNITFINNSGDSPIINGSISNTNDLTWSLETSGIYSTSLPNSEIYQVIVDDIRYYFRDGGLSEIVNAGDGFYTDGSKLYVRVTDGTSPSGHDVQVPEDHTGVSGFSGFITTFSDSWWFEGITFGYYGNSGNIRALYLRSSPEAVIKNCTFKFIRSVSIFVSSCPLSLIENNIFIDNTHLMNDFKYVKSRAPLPSTDYGVEGAGTLVISNNQINNQIVVRNNNWSGIVDIVVLAPIGGGVVASDPPQHCIDIHDNYSEFSVGENIAPDGAWSNIRIYNHTNFSSAFGLGFATPAGGPIYVIKNCLYNLGRFIAGEDPSTPTGQFGKSFVKWNSPPDDVKYVASSFFYHNTFIMDYSGLNVDRAKGDTSSVDGRTLSLLVQVNNILSSVRYIRSYVFFGINPDNYQYNNNILYSTSPSFKYRQLGNHLTSLTAWQSATNLDLDAIDADPMITGECELDSGSPALNTAINIRGISDWIGHNNIGAK